MATGTFDTLKHANALKAAGMPSDQAEALVGTLSEVFQSSFKELATKEDVQRASAEVRQEFNAKIDNAKQELNAKIDAAKQELNAKIDTSTAKNDGQFTLLRWMLGINLTVTTGILIRLFFFRP
jgi:hypothetical protein